MKVCRVYRVYKVDMVWYIGCIDSVYMGRYIGYIWGVCGSYVGGCIGYIGFRVCSFEGM